MTCIKCPLGCRMLIELDPGEKVLSLKGNFCPKGESYAREELTHPQRTLTTSLKILGASRELVSVKTSSPIPKSLVWEAQEFLRHQVVDAPVNLGQGLVENLLGTGVNVVATRDVLRTPQG